ncbi:MAG: hypothetical protein ACOY3P_06055 [Planctomycetota bacterium]
MAFLIYFPGRQSTLAITLATGLGVERLQQRVDVLEEKAIAGLPFTQADRVFLKDLYTCFAKGARLTVNLRQSAELMDHYLGRSGEDLEIEPRVFVGSREVQQQVTALRREIASDLRQRRTMNDEYTSPTFYMGDPEFLESHVALYFGHISVRPHRMSNGNVLLQWRADMPWEWPSYDSLRAKHGDPHAQCFPLPNLKSMLLGPKYSLRVDDGLGEHLTKIGLAKPFRVFSQWESHIDVPVDEGQHKAR